MSWLKSIPVLLWSAALILVGWILYQLPLTTITQSLSTLTITQWLAWISINLAIIALATQRWLTLIKGLGLSVKFNELLMIRQAGQAISFITPGPQFGGEPLQIYWLWKRNHWPIHSALLAVGIDRFYELWINFGVLLLNLILLMTTSITGQATTINWQVMFLGLLLILLVLSLLAGLILKQPDRVLAWIKRVTHYWQHHPRLQHIETHWQRLSSDLKSLMTKHKAELALAFVWSLIGWIGLISELWLILSFFDIALTFYSFMLILVAMRLAFLLPLPGGIGTLESSLFWVFQILGLPLTVAISVMALMRLRDAVTLLIGLCCVQALK